MPEPKNPTDTTEAVVEHGKILAAAPRRSDILGGLGKKKRGYLRDKEDGSWELQVPREDTKAIRALDELERPSRRLHVERTSKVMAGRPKVAVRSVDGRRITIDATNENMAARIPGCLPVVSYGGWTVVSGPDGMLWRNIAKVWVPTGRTCLGTPLDPEDDGVARGPQEDPDGNMWELNPETGEWAIRLYSEEREG